MPYVGPYNVKFVPGTSMDPELQALSLVFRPGYAKTWARPSEEAFYGGTVAGELLGQFDPNLPGEWVYFRKPFDREPINWNECTCDADALDEFDGAHSWYCNLSNDPE